MSAAAFAPIRRATLWIPGTGSSHDQHKTHLFVILTDPCPEGMVLVIPICSVTEKSDNTCLLGAGDHPKLNHKSFAAYYRMNTFKAAVLIEQEQKRVIQSLGPLDEKIFAMVSAGVMKSCQSAPIYKKYFSEQTEKGKANKGKIVR